MTGGGRRRPRRGVAVLSLVAVTAPLACGGDGGAGGATAGSSRPSSVATVTDGAPTSMERETDVGQEAKEPTKSVTTTKTAPGPPTTPPSADHPPTSVPATPTTTATTGTLSTTMGSPPPGGVTQGGPGSATRLSASSGCEGTPPRDVVRMRWQPSGAGRQRIDVTVLDNGFQPGTFESSHVLGAGESSLRWDHSRGEATHYWRVVTLVSGRWVASQTASFEGPGCVGSDFQPR